MQSQIVITQTVADFQRQLLIAYQSKYRVSQSPIYRQSVGFAIPPPLCLTLGSQQPITKTAKLIIMNGKCISKKFTYEILK